MRPSRLPRLASSLVLVLVAHGEARAALLTLSVTSTLSAKVGELPDFSMGAVASVPVLVSSGGGSFVEPAGFFSGSVALPTALFTGLPLFHGLTFAGLANGAGSFAQGAPAGPRNHGILRAGGGFGGFAPLQGTATVNVLALFNVSVPLGVVGNTGATLTVVSGGLTLTAQGTGWTTGVVRVTDISTFTTNRQDTTFSLTFSGYDNRTPGHAGVLQLVSPFRVISNAFAAPFAGVARQTLVFTPAVPEPGTLMLLGTGVGALALRAWRGRRRPLG